MMGNRIVLVIVALVAFSALGPSAHSGTGADIAQAPVIISDNSITFSDDWLVNATENYANTSIYLEGNLTIDAGGSLTLVNTTLTLNISENGEHWIRVYGDFGLFDNSRIRSNDSAFSYFMEAQDGSALDFRDSAVTDCGFSSSFKGLVVNTPDAIFDGMNFTENYYGLSLRRDGASVRNCTFDDNYVGIEFYNSDGVFDNNTVMNSTSYGLYLYGSSSPVNHSRFITNGEGINMRYSDSIIEHCEITGSAVRGLYLYASSPLVVNSTLSNTNELRVVTDSFPRLLNTTLNQSSVSVGFGLHVSIGQFVDVVVKNETGEAVYNATVTILDKNDNPASSGRTNASGAVNGLSFRERFITNDGTIEFPAHRVMAFQKINGTVWLGENYTVLTPGAICIAEVHQNPVNVLFWESGRTITGMESYNNSQIISTGGVQVDWSGNLSLNGTDILFFSDLETPIGFTAMDGQMSIFNSKIYSIGANRPLKPGRILFRIMPDFAADIESLELRWPEKLEVFSDSADLRNIGITHSKDCGLEISSGADPVVSGITVNWAANGVNIASGMGTVTDVSLSNVRKYGLYASQADGAVSGFTVSGASKGVYALSSALHISDFDVRSCGYGVHALYSMLNVQNSTFDGSGSYGIFELGGGLKLTGSDVQNCSSGIWLQDSLLENTIESCHILNNGVGIGMDECNPVILNSTLSNPTDISVKRATSAALVNSTFQPANLTIEPSGFVDVGYWASVTVRNETMSPVNGSKVAIYDSNGDVSDAGVTGPDGKSGPLAFREDRVYWNRTESCAEHTVIAYASIPGIIMGENSTALTPDCIVSVILSATVSDTYLWPDGHVIFSDEEYYDKTIIAEGDVVVQSSVTLSLIDSTIWLFGDKYTGDTLTFDGVLNMSGSFVAPLGTVAPLQPKRFDWNFNDRSEAEIYDMNFAGLGEIVVYTDSFAISNSRIRHFSKSGIRVEDASPTIENVYLNLCYDGITLNGAMARIGNSTMLENGRYGAHASSGAPAVADCLFVKNDQGARFDYNAAGSLSGGLVTDNKNGIYLYGASPTIDSVGVVDNSNYGIYCSDSYAIINGSTISDNKYGIYCTYSAPEIYNTDIFSNNFGLYIYSSGPYIQNSRIEDNAYGIYDVGDAENLEATAFASGRGEEVVTFVTGGIHDKYAIRLPKRAVLKSANMSIEGIVIRNEAVEEQPDAQLNPNIYGDWLVWQDNRNDDWDIYAYNLSLDSDGNDVPNYMETPQLEDDPALVHVTKTPGTQLNPDIWGDTVVWSDLRCCNFDIWAYTFSNDTEWQVTDNPATQWRPAIYGDHVVWSDDRNGHSDIYMANISRPEETRLSVSTWNDMGAKIDNGKVVWYSYFGSPGQDEFSDIFYFNIDKWSRSNITDDRPIQYSPDVYGDTIVWHDNRQTNWEIFKYDIKSGLEERLTFEDEQSFAPRIHEDRVVYYYHDRVKDLWPVRMYDLKTGVQTEIETEAYGDGQPVVYGDRVAWVNKSNFNPDIYVLDFNIIGYPQNVSADVGCDGDFEFQRPGEFNESVFLNEDVLLGELEDALPGMGGGTMDIPINVTFDGTGRVGLSQLSVIYDLPAFVVNSSIGNNTNIGVQCQGSSPRFVNSTLYGNPTDFTVSADGNPILLNTTFSDSKLNFAGKLANLTVQNFLHLKAMNMSGEAVNATALVLDNGRTVFDRPLGDDGMKMWIVVTDARYNQTGKNDNETVVNLTSGTFDSNPRSVDMGFSHWEIFTTDNTLPRATKPFPLPDWPHSNLSPTMSVWITDDEGIDQSTVRFYVQGYSVFYSVAPITGGYNVSYQHGPGFVQGETVTCRVVAEDYYGNSVDYSWSFVIDINAQTFSIALTSGWNLVSVPFEPANTSMEGVLISIAGIYDLVQYYDHFAGWKTYSAYRPAALNNLAEIDHKMGFWVHVKYDCTLVVSGIPETSTGIQLYAGWNLVGYPTLNQSTTAGNALWGTSADAVEGFDYSEPYFIKELNPNYVMKPGEGYWIHVPADTVWIIDW